ncbi:nitroreductase family deazaflavin-dependent oxidoreductase [Dictyobacter aurantiacus]|uniref:Nitroreductase n=1 Tax=Dictyobacter aurantiacus TaxID=1936993 RepID=A0A401ZS73_9CHLR|nr:nitroreductase family deazaflavin-dependent oxidoreductase [Dictyobacter aurantiacus]GCE09739.1 hypothetical protein KDAU_70680 [Dictyobacter aurantiacus]
MSNLHERNDVDVTNRDTYDLENKAAFKKQMDMLNPPVIQEFRASDGKIGGQFTGHDILLLHTIGAKSQQPRINPVGYVPYGDAILIIASKGGAPTNPDWYYNILAHPEVELEVGTERFKAHARITEGEERDRLFAIFTNKEPGMGEYQTHTTRLLPVIVLTRI